jgi:REP element-mobilizing transposase RayT
MGLRGSLLLLISALIKMGVRKSTQLPLSFRQHGGRRAGAGRKPGPGRGNVRHRARAKLASRFPVLVTLRAERGVGNLRRKRAFRPIERAFGDVAVAAEAGAPFRVVHYSVQRDHIHLLVEAKGRTALSRGMQGLGIRVAKALNGALGRRRGRVWADRYHDRVLRTPREVRHALAYTLQNARKHGVAPPRASRRWVDPCSSAAWFDGWRGPIVVPPGAARSRATGPPVASPHTWLLRVGWRRHGLLVPWRGAGG